MISSDVISLIDFDVMKFCEDWWFRDFDIFIMEFVEAATQRCFWEKVFWKYVANLQENSHAEVRFQ